MVGNRFAVCGQCPPGRFQEKSFAAFNANLDPNTVASELWDCAHCPAGYAQDRAGATSCTNCPGGLVSEVSSPVCVVGCKKGTYRPTNKYATATSLFPVDLCLK